MEVATHVTTRPGSNAARLDIGDIIARHSVQAVQERIAQLRATGLPHAATALERELTAFQALADNEHTAAHRPRGVVASVPRTGPRLGCRGDTRLPESLP
jgi:hypothetical protein